MRKVKKLLEKTLAFNNFGLNTLMWIQITEKGKSLLFFIRRCCCRGSLAGKRCRVRVIQLLTAFWRCVWAFLMGFCSLGSEGLLQSHVWQTWAGYFNTHHEQLRRSCRYGGWHLRGKKKILIYFPKQTSSLFLWLKISFRIISGLVLEMCEQHSEIMEKEVQDIQSGGDTSNKVMLVHTSRKADDKAIIIMLL